MDAKLGVTLAVGFSVPDRGKIPHQGRKVTDLEVVPEVSSPRLVWPSQNKERSLLTAVSVSPMSLAPAPILPIVSLAIVSLGRLDRDIPSSTRSAAKYVPGVDRV
jgi:hypothetical protein